MADKRKLIDPVFTATPDGWSISGLDVGRMVIYEDAIAIIREWSQEGRLYPFMIEIVREKKTAPGYWLCKVVEWTNAST
jgi:hypothetical protein